jgi:hypothetical protein
MVTTENLKKCFCGGFRRDLRVKNIELTCSEINFSTDKKSGKPYK